MIYKDFFVGTRPNGFTLEPMRDEDWKCLVVTEEDLARMALTEENLRRLYLGEHDLTALLLGQMDQEQAHGDPRPQTNPD